MPVHEPEVKTSTPRSPGAASAAVESLPVSSQETGSWVPSRHTLPRSVVGFVPSAWNRTRSTSPGATVTPGTVADDRTVSVPPTVRVRYAVTEPPATYRSLSR